MANGADGVWCVALGSPPASLPLEAVAWRPENPAARLAGDRLIAGDQPLSSGESRDGSRQAISVRSGIIILAVVTVQLDRDSKETVMPSKDHVEKSCDSQLLPAGDPTSEWGLDHLGVYAQLQYRQIMDGEKSLTATIDVWDARWFIPRRSLSMGAGANT